MVTLHTGGPERSHGHKHFNNEMVHASRLHSPIIAGASYGWKELGPRGENLRATSQPE